MSKPKHYRRGKGRYLGYGYSTCDLNKKKCEWTYWANLTNEIENIKHHGGTHVAKLRKYLKRVS